MVEGTDMLEGVDVPDGTQIAAFEDEPDAQAAATLLRELGFSARVIERSDGPTYDDRMRAFFSGRPVDFEIHAVLLSDAEAQRFAREVQVHHGFVIGHQHSTNAGGTHASKNDIAKDVTIELP